MKLIIDNPEIKYLIVDKATEKITESGEEQGNNDTFEETFIDLNSIEVGKPPKISFNKGVYTRRANPKKPVWVDLLYNVLEIQESKKELINC